MNISKDRLLGGLQFNPIYLVIVFAFMDNFIQLPIISTFAKTLNEDEFFIGSVVGVYSLSNMVGNLLAGSIIAKIGRKNSILTGLLFTSLILLCYPLITAPWQLILIRVLHGLGISIVTPAAFAQLGDSMAEGERGAGMAKSGIAVSIAALLGPMLGGMLKQFYGVETVFVFMASWLVFMVVIFRKILSESTMSEIEPNIVENIEAESKVSLKKVILKPELIWAYLPAFALMFAKGTLAYFLAIKLERLGFKASVTGMLFSTFALAAILVFATSMGKLSDKIGRQKPILLGILGIALSLLLLNYVTILPLLVLVMLLYGYSFGILFPAAAAVVVDCTDSQERSFAYGVYYAVFSLGAFLGPSITGYAGGHGFPPFVLAAMALFGIASFLYFQNNIKEVSRVESL